MSISQDEINDIESLLAKLSLSEKICLPKVSVIIPAYNTEKYITRCLISLLKQTLREIEVIIVDDGSKDDTLKIAELFAKYDTRFRAISQEHKLQGAARNLGVKNATGEYIGFVDSDDWVDSYYYEKLYAAAKKYDSDLAMADYVRIGNGKTKKRLNIQSEKCVSGFKNICYVSDIAKNPCPTNKIYRKEMLSANNIIWDEGFYCEDKIYTLKALFYANALVTVPGCNYYYFRNPQSTVKKLDKMKTHKFDKKKAQIKVLDFLKENNVDIEDKIFWVEDINIKISQLSLFKIKRSLHTKTVSIFGIQVLEICDAADYNRKEVVFLGIKFTCKNK